MIKSEMVYNIYFWQTLYFAIFMNSEICYI